MPIFFDTIDAIHLFTFSLDQRALLCASCSARGQFVSHGFCYKQKKFAATTTVGKRILCSNRSGRTGCGRTVQLYLASEIPSLHYGASHLFVFITALLANLSIAAAYCKAVGQSEYRHAWRWFKKLMRQLTVYRLYLHRDDHQVLPMLTALSRSRQVLLPTLSALFFRLPYNVNPIEHFQQTHQVRFM